MPRAPSLLNGERAGVRGEDEGKFLICSIVPTYAFWDNTSLTISSTA